MYPTAPAYGPRRSGSSSSMISIARTFGAPVIVPGRERRAKHVQPGYAVAQLALDLTHDVKHVRVLLDAA